jgi:hypothetical protein
MLCFLLIKSFYAHLSVLCGHRFVTSVHSPSAQLVNPGDLILLTNIFGSLRTGASGGLQENTRRVVQFWEHTPKVDLSCHKTAVSEVLFRPDRSNKGIIGGYSSCLQAKSLNQVFQTLVNLGHSCSPIEGTRATNKHVPISVGKDWIIQPRDCRRCRSHYMNGRKMPTPNPLRKAISMMKLAGFWTIMSRRSC